MNVHSSLFIRAKKWEPKCPSTDEWINKMQYICAMGYYSLKERNKLLMNAMTWMNLENIKLSERSQTHTKTNIVRFNLYKSPK